MVKPSPNVCYLRIPVSCFCSHGRAVPSAALTICIMHEARDGLVDIHFRFHGAGAELHLAKGLNFLNSLDTRRSQIAELVIVSLFFSGFEWLLENHISRARTRPFTSTILSHIASKI